MNCDTLKNCKGFFYLEFDKICHLLKYRPTVKKAQSSQKLYCGKVNNARLSSGETCALEAHLKHDTADTVVGFHSDSMIVTNQEDEICGFYYFDNDWCTYVATENQYYKDEAESALMWEAPYYNISVSTEEIITINNAAQHTYLFQVEHIFDFAEETFYYQNETQDFDVEATAYLHAAQLSIINKSNNKPVKEKKKSVWSHEVEIGNHPFMLNSTGSWINNTHYNAYLHLEVTCTLMCHCEAKTLFSPPAYY